MKSLLEVFPHLAQQWDYELNGDLTPDKVSYGSNMVVWWRCPKCGHSYQKRVGNRTAPSRREAESDKCPICLGRIVVPGFNSLKARYPEIIENEWDYIKNEVDPDTIPPTFRQKCWWLCANGHSYETLPGNKIYDTGGNCPYCSSQRLCRETSLGYQNPTLAQTWHPTRNGVLTPFDVFANSNKNAWWLCPICGYEWSAKISNRNIGKRGCPHCASGRSSSIPEQLLYRAIKKYFPDAVSRYKLIGDEIDVFIPSLNIGFEYDGKQYHDVTKLPFDLEKTRRLVKSGVFLYRFRELGCPDIEIENCTVIPITYSADHKDLEEKTKNILEQLLSETVEINFDSEINDVIANLDRILYESSFAYHEEKRNEEGDASVAIWDYEENSPLTPEMVAPFSDKIVSWVCPNNSSHRWRNTIKSVSLGYGCRRCSKKRIYTTPDWVLEAIKVHGDKFQYTKVCYVDSETKVDIICPKHGVFQQLPYEHLAGKGCPYCAHQLFHPKESLAELHPEIASEWDYELNADTGFNPANIGIDTKRRFYWRCNNGLNHSYLSTVAFRVGRNSGCAICHGKQICKETSLGYLNPLLASEWCEENDKTPFEVTVKSDYNALWKCPNPNHPPYRQKVEVRSRGVGCVYCHRGKIHPKDFEEEIRAKFPYIKLLSEFTRMSDKVRCICELCGHIWSQTGNHLMKGKGCPKCRGNHITKN